MTASTGRRRPPAAPPDPTDERAAYLAGLRLLGGRELASAQVRDRLLQRGFAEPAVIVALERLVKDGAIDDARVARVRAQGALRKHRGRDRAARELVHLGLAPDLVDDVIGQVFGSLDERDLVEQALDRRLKGAPVGSPAEWRRLHAHLSRLGFSSSAIVSVLRRRSRGVPAPQDD